MMSPSQSTGLNVWKSLKSGFIIFIAFHRKSRQPASDMVLNYPECLLGYAVMHRTHSTKASLVAGCCQHCTQADFAPEAGKWSTPKRTLEISVNRPRDCVEIKHHHCKHHKHVTCRTFAELQARLRAKTKKDMTRDISGNHSEISGQYIFPLLSDCNCAPKDSPSSWPRAHRWNRTWSNQNLISQIKMKVSAVLCELNLHS